MWQNLLQCMARTTWQMFSNFPSEPKIVLLHIPLQFPGSSPIINVATIIISQVLWWGRTLFIEGTTPA